MTTTDTPGPEELAAEQEARDLAATLDEPDRAGAAGVRPVASASAWQLEETALTAAAILGPVFAAQGWTWRWTDPTWEPDAERGEIVEDVPSEGRLTLAIRRQLQIVDDGVRGSGTGYFEVSSGRILTTAAADPDTGDVTYAVHLQVADLDVFA